MKNLRRKPRPIPLKTSNFLAEIGWGRERIVMSHKCRHIMPNGAKCHAPALRGKPYCYFHTRLHRFAAEPPIPPTDPPAPLLEDRSAIQIALAQVLDALCSSRIDPRRAGLFLYALQIASQNVARNLDDPHHSRRIPHPHRQRRRARPGKAHLRHPRRLRRLCRPRHLRRLRRRLSHPRPLISDL